MVSPNAECQIYEPLISVMLDDELTTLEQEQLQSHLDSCRSCRKKLAGFSRVNDAVSLLSRVPEDQWKSVTPNGFENENFHIEKPVKKRMAFSVWRLIPLAVAATVLVCLAITMLPTPNPVTADQVTPEQIVRPIKELHMINLQQKRDQELMLRTLGMDLRSLRLEVAQIAPGSEEQQKLQIQINEMIEKVNQFELQSQTEF